MRSNPYFGSRTALSDDPSCAPTSRKTFIGRSPYFATLPSEQRCRAKEDERRCDRQSEVRIGEQAERVEHDHEQGCQRQRDQRPRAPRPSPAEPDQPERDPDDRAGKPAGQLVESKRELRIALAVRQRGKEPIAFARDLLEAWSLLRLGEDEVMFGCGGPDVADAVVGAGDPDVLSGGDRLALGRRR